MGIKFLGMGMASCLSCPTDKGAIRWSNIGSRKIDIAMATVNWPEPKTFFNDKQFGFDFRNILHSELAAEGERTSVTSKEEYIGTPPSKLPKDKTTLEVSGPHDGVADKYSGTFVVAEDGTRTTTTNNGVTTSTFVGYQWIESGTITGYTRSTYFDTTGTIKAIEIDYKEAADAGATPDKADDMALWAKAFAGNDTFVGSSVADRLEGFAGKDKITGRLGADKLYGGADGDTFVFTSIKDSTVSAGGRDIVYDFSHSQKDKIDLKAIDANTKATGNQAFRYIGTQDFHKKAGELLWDKIKGGVQIQADVNGDGKADFSLTLKNVTKLATGDFFL